MFRDKFHFTFGNSESAVFISEDLPSADEVTDGRSFLAVCDSNTEFLAHRIFDGSAPKAAVCVLAPGETSKCWASVETILKSAAAAGLDRSSVLIGIGGGVVTDLCAFAASIYMRGIRAALVSTTLLGMVDASVGGKTGFDLFGIKNLAGTFYPAEKVFMPLASLESLPEYEWKSGMAELIKTAVLADDDFLQMVKTLKNSRENLAAAVSAAVEFKGRIVEKDPRETGSVRALLNLGHTFGHALESSMGLGKISHGEAVAWGMARACELGRKLGITPAERAAAIMEVLNLFGYQTKTPYPGMDKDRFMSAIVSDKKKKSGKMTFILPAKQGAQIVMLEDNKDIEIIINGEYRI